MKKYIIMFTALIILTSCMKDDINKSNIRLDKELISELNYKSYDTLMIDSNKFVLDAYMWRDFMPISPPNGKSLISTNSLRDIDSTNISDNIDLIEQYVIYNDSIWISKYDDESNSTQLDYKIEKTSREGPNWGPKIQVDVISKVHDDNTNRDYYIRIRNIYIERTN